RRRHTRFSRDWSSDVCSSDLEIGREQFRWFNGMMKKHYREELTDVAIMVSPGGGRASAEFTVNGTYLATAEGLPEAKGQKYVLRSEERRVGKEERSR